MQGLPFHFVDLTLSGKHLFTSMPAFQLHSCWGQHSVPQHKFNQSSLDVYLGYSQAFAITDLYLDLLTYF